ncbi:MAG: hypothetical protein WC447_01565 [Candidatus Paceibacterota bacterium]|jgi:hypothetical protein
MEYLKEKLNKLIDELSSDKRDIIRSRLSDLVSVYPFNEYEYIISSLMGFGKITLDDYYEIRDDYVSRNMYLYIFEIASPRGFGELWAQGHIKELEPDFIKPTKKVDENYSGQYDLALPIENKFITIEVKASRAVDGGSSEPLFVKALSYECKSPFWMNFQQIKPACADVFLWVAVWRDVIKYWVLSSDEVKNNKYYSKGQHRGNNGEGQLHIKEDNINEFKKYEVKSNKLKEAVIDAYKRQKGIK